MKISSLMVLILLSGVIIEKDKKQFILNHDADLTSLLGKDYIYYRIEVTEKELELADSLIDQYLLNNQNKYNWTSMVSDYDSYYRQYAGYTQFSSERKIVVNAFKIRNKNISNEFLKSHLYIVMGGGISFFSIKVNLQTKTCSDLRVNAPR